MNPLRFAALALVLLAVACTDSSSTPCAPDCMGGETCVFGVCRPSCTPACGAGQQCVATGGLSRCVGVDAGIRPDASLDAADAGDATIDTGDVTQTDAALDGSADSPLVTDTPVITDGATDGTIDAPVTADAPADGPIETDVGVDVPVVMDAPTDTRISADAPVDMPVVIDAPDVPPPPPCGGTGEPCCGLLGSETACRDGLVCNGTVHGTCVDVMRDPGECRPSAGCGPGRVCGGPTGCSDRWCYRCVIPGSLAFDMPCDSAMEGRDCNSGVCQRGRCTYACSLGAAGDTQCANASAGSICVAQYYGIDLDGGTPARWNTLGYCVRACARASDCPSGRACVATANLVDDRIDFVCQTTTRPGLPGSACTSGAMCQSGLCLTVTGAPSECLAPCTTNADCPAAAPVCGPLSLYRPSSGATYVSHGCVPR